MGDAWKNPTYLLMRKCLLKNKEQTSESNPRDHSSQSITSSGDFKMSNWTASEIQEMVASPWSLAVWLCPLVVVTAS